MRKWRWGKPILNWIDSNLFTTYYEMYQVFKWKYNISLGILFRIAVCSLVSMSAPISLLMPWTISIAASLWTATAMLTLTSLLLPAISPSLPKESTSRAATAPSILLTQGRLFSTQASIALGYYSQTENQCICYHKLILDGLWYQHIFLPSWSPQWQAVLPDWA